MVLPVITFIQGNLLDSDAEAVVNTVNTQGIMGKGIALMFKERFPHNFKLYRRACKSGEVRIGSMFVTENNEIFGPVWIINFPTKTHWRVKTRLEWISQGLQDLVCIVKERGIRSLAVPPLGCGNGGLDWRQVRPLIVDALSKVEGLEVMIYEPTPQYQNVVERKGVEKLTPARALLAEVVRRYCQLGNDCSILEVQKLAWFLERGVRHFQRKDPLNLMFVADRYGPYSHRLSKLLGSLDGSYLLCEKHLSDADPLDRIRCNDYKKGTVADYFRSNEGKEYQDVLEWTSAIVDGFESPLGMELLATVDWLVEREGAEPTVAGIRQGLSSWRGGPGSAQRKLRVLDGRLIEIALQRLRDNGCSGDVVKSV